MLLELYVIFGVLTFILLAVGIWFRDQYIFAASGIVMVLMGFWLAGGGIDVPSGSTTIQTNVFENVSSAADVGYNLLNSTITETSSHQNVKDLNTGAFGTILMALGSYLVYLGWIDWKMSRAK